MENDPLFDEIETGRLYDRMNIRKNNDTNIWNFAKVKPLNRIDGGTPTF